MKLEFKLKAWFFLDLLRLRQFYPQQKKNWVVFLIDIGGGTTSIAAFIDGALCYSGVIPIGAKNVTNDLAIGLRVSLKPRKK